MATGRGVSPVITAALIDAGADGAMLTPGRATSVLEKKIALLKKKIELKRGAAPREGSARPSASAGSSHQPAMPPLLTVRGDAAPEIVAHQGLSSLAGGHVTTAVSLSTSSAAQPHLSQANNLQSSVANNLQSSALSSAAAQPSGSFSKTREVGISGKVREDGRPAVGDRRQRSPNVEMDEANRPPPLLELRRRSPAAETLRSDSPQRPVEVLGRSNQAPASANPGAEGVFNARLQFGGRSRSPAAEAEDGPADRGNSTDIRRRSPSVAAAVAPAPADVAVRPVEHQEVRRLPAAATVSCSASFAAKDRDSRSSVLLLGGASADKEQGDVAVEIDSAGATAHCVNIDVLALETALTGPALSAESLQRAREVAERRLRGVRRLMEENLREDLELQVSRVDLVRPESSARVFFSTLA